MGRRAAVSVQAMRKLHSAGVVPTKQAFGIGGGARAPPKGRLKGDEGVDEVGRAPLYLYLPCTFPVPSLYLLCTFPVPSLHDLAARRGLGEA